MKKGKSITLLTIIMLIMAVLIVMTFVPFPVGVKNYNSVFGAIQADYDIAGGTAYTMQLDDDNVKAVEDINEVKETLEYRLKALGYDNFSVKAIRPEGQSHADYSFRIEAKASLNEYGEPNYATLDSDMKVVATYGELEFYGGTSSSPTDKILEGKKVISKVETLTTKSVDSVVYLVNITFTDDAYKFIEEQMKAGSYYFKITLGDVVLSPFDGTSALSQNSFGKTVSVTTSSKESANQMALQITSGGLAYKYTTPERVGDVSSPFGENTIRNCVIAVAGVILCACIVLLIAYKGFGFASTLSMILFIVLELCMLVAIPGIKVSMGGVVGIILATVLALDGFIITAKRVAEEFANGKTVKAAFNTGFRRAIRPILSGGVISGITSLVLFFMTNGQIKGFAITFGIGTVLAVISALLFARMFAYLLLGIVSNKEKFFKLKRKADKLNEKGAN